MGKEAELGTSAAITNFIPCTGDTFASDPGLFFPNLMQALRDKQVYPLYGQEKDGGNIEAPFFPTNGIPLLSAAIGQDGGAANAPLGYGITGASPTGSLTLGAAASIGDTTVTLSGVTGVTPMETVIQIDVNSAGATSSECRLVTGLSGDVATVAALSFGHLSGVAVKVVTAPFEHTILEANQLPSLTIEKNIGNFQSLLFSGARVGKYSIKAQSDDTAAMFTADMNAQWVQVQDSPTAVSVVNEDPFVFAEYQLEWDGNVLAQATNFALDIDNSLKLTWTFNQTHSAQFLSPVELAVNGSFDVVFDSLDDDIYGYFTDALSSAPVEGALSFGMTHAGTAGGIGIELQTVRLKKTDQKTTAGTVVTESVDFAARYSLSAETPYTIRATVTNGAYLPY